jgi:cation-transporting ATPase 13A1
LTENRPLLWSLAATFVLTFMFASETVPGLNRYFQLVSFPEESFRDFILLLLGADLVATFAWDRIMQFFFCRDILIASVKDITLRDVFGFARTLFVIAFIMNMFIGNSEQWDVMLAMEQNKTLNSTNDTGISVDNVVETLKECVGAFCDASVASVKDEF